MSRPWNNRHALKTCGHGDVARDLLTFDVLPRRLRSVLHETVVSFCARCLREFLHLADEDAAIEAVLDREARELWAFSDQHMERFGTPSAHVAADATIQRYL